MNSDRCILEGRELKRHRRFSMFLSSSNTKVLQPLPRNLVKLLRPVYVKRSNEEGKMCLTGSVKFSFLFKLGLLEVVLLSRGHKNVSAAARLVLSIWKKLENEFGHKSYLFFTIRNLLENLKSISASDEVLGTFKNLMATELSQRLECQEDKDSLAIMLFADKAHATLSDTFEGAIQSAAEQLELVLTPSLLKSVHDLDNFDRLNKSIIISGETASGKTTTWKVCCCLYENIIFFLIFGVISALFGG
jgi:type IV secretory pathway ATPase VirB11/archaellum biosynthesis ATPase